MAKKVQNKSEISLLEVAGSYTTLEKSGAEYTGLCPLNEHVDTDPSFSVNSTKQVWFCHGCKKGGDVYELIMLIHRCTFPEAMSRVEDQWDYDLSALRKPGKKAKPKDSIGYEANAAAAEFFHRQLTFDQYDETDDTKWSPGEREQVVAYLEERQLDLGTVNRWQIGYSLKNPLTLSSAGLEGFTLDELNRAGLLSKTESGQFRDVFSGRLTFPIKDQRSRVCGFTARTIWKGKTSKYINTRATDWFEKSKIVLNIDRVSTVASADSIVVVEGPLDLIAVDKAGYPQVVSTLGTSLTDQQAALIEALGVKKVIFFGDGDISGLNASIIRSETMLAFTPVPFAVETPKDMDPAGLFKEGGSKVISMLLEERTFPYLKFLVNRVGIQSWENKLHLLRYVEEQTEQLQDIVKRDLLLAEVLEIIGLEKKHLSSKKPDRKKSPLRGLKERSKTTTSFSRIEFQILWVVMHYHDHAAVTEMLMQLRSNLTEVFSSEATKIFSWLIHCIETGEVGLINDESLQPTVLELRAKRPTEVEPDWSRFLVKVSRWVTLQRVKVRTETEANTEADDLVSYLETARNLLKSTEEQALNGH